MNIGKSLLRATNVNDYSRIYTKKDDFFNKKNPNFFQ
jgi:hypothetical protein